MYAGAALPRAQGAAAAPTKGARWLRTPAHVGCCRRLAMLRTALNADLYPARSNGAAPAPRGSSPSGQQQKQRRRRPPPPRVAMADPPSSAPSGSASSQDYVANLNATYGLPSFVEFYVGEGGLPAAYLLHPRGHTAEVYLHGATVTRWLDDAGVNLLFLRPDAVFDGVAPINSGVPLAFPQYREEGVLPDNGFAGRLPWEVVDAGLDTALLNAEGGLADVELPPGYSPDWTDAQLAEAIGAGAEEDDDEEDDVEGGGGEEDEEEEERGGAQEAGGASAAAADAEAARQAFGIGAVGDPAPYVILRLADSAATRALGWPHAFELLLKVTLSEADDFANPKGDLRRGVFAYAGGAGVPHPASREERDAGAMLAMDAAELPDAAADAEPAMQLKLEFALRNPGGSGSSGGSAGGGGAADAPFEFQLGALSHFATRDLNRHGDFVKVLGLGGANTLDYGADPRFAQLGFVNDDYVHFGGQRVEAVFINTHGSDVKLCPGDRTHFELALREGMRDHVAYHPGPLPPPGTEAFAPRYVVVGAGRLSLPKELKAGETWYGDYVIRRQQRYWQLPIWDRRALQPMPQMVPVLDEDEGEEEGEEGEDGEGDFDGGGDGGAPLSG